MSIEALLSNFDRLIQTPESVQRLRRFILDLAVRGKLVPQDPKDEPASELLKRTAKEKARLVKAGEIKKSKVKPARMAEAPFELPRSWEWSALGELFLYDAGTKREPASLDQNLWLLELEDIEKDTGHLLARIQASGRESKSTKSEFRVGDILYGKLRPYLNKVIVADEPGYSTTEIIALRPYLPICSQYCALALRRPDFVTYVTRLGQGTKMPRLRTEDAIIAPFPLPPLTEQSRIVAKVDELMGLCDRLETTQTERETTRTRLTVASLARLNSPDPDGAKFREDVVFVLDNFTSLTTRPEQVKALRRTILDLAVRGKLVPQDPDDEPASELLKRIAKEKAHGKRKASKEAKGVTGLNDLPTNWSLVPLITLGSWAIGSGFPKSEQGVTDGRYFFLKVSDMNLPGNEKYVTVANNYIDEAAATRLRTKIHPPGTIIFPKIGGAIATNKRRILTGEAAIDNNCLGITFSNEVNIEWAYLLLSTFDFAQYQAGTAVPALQQGRLGEIPVMLPPFAEQRRIVANVDSIMTLCNRLEENLETGDDAYGSTLDALLQESLKCDGRLVKDCQAV